MFLEDLSNPGKYLKTARTAKFSSDAVAKYRTRVNGATLPAFPEAAKTPRPTRKPSHLQSSGTFVHTTFFHSSSIFLIFSPKLGRPLKKNKSGVLRLEPENKSQEGDCGAQGDGKVSRIIFQHKAVSSLPSKKMAEILKVNFFAQTGTRKMQRESSSILFIFRDITCLGTKVSPRHQRSLFSKDRNRGPCRRSSPTTKSLPGNSWATIFQGGLVRSAWCLGICFETDNPTSPISNHVTHFKDNAMNTYGKYAPVSFLVAVISSGHNIYFEIFLYYRWTSTSLQTTTLQRRDGNL